MGWHMMPLQKFDHPQGEQYSWEYCDEGACKHKDCAYYWEQRNTPCKFCDKLIEEDFQYYLLEGKKQAHFSCFHNVKKHFGI